MRCMEVWGGNAAVESGISVHGVDAWISSQPYHGESSGGDIHYVSMCGQGRIARFVLADVAGHGEAAGELALQLRTLMRRHITKADQTRFARSLNRTFGRLSRRGVFATAALVTYFAPTDQFITSLAGHPRPLWYQASAHRWTLLPIEAATAGSAAPDLPFGVIPTTAYHQSVVTLGKGDMVVLYTDALIETGGSSPRSIGESGLLHLATQLTGADPTALGRALIESVDEEFGLSPETRTDDLTLLVLHHTAADPPPMSLGHKARMMSRMLGLWSHRSSR